MRYTVMTGARLAGLRYRFMLDFMLWGQIRRYLQNAISLSQTTVVTLLHR